MLVPTFSLICEVHLSPQAIQVLLFEANTFETREWGSNLKCLCRQYWHRVLVKGITGFIEYCSFGQLLYETCPLYKRRELKLNATEKNFAVDVILNC